MKMTPLFSLIKRKKKKAAAKPVPEPVPAPVAKPTYAPPTPPMYPPPRQFTPPVSPLQDDEPGKKGIKGISMNMIVVGTVVVFVIGSVVWLYSRSGRDTGAAQEEEFIKEQARMQVEVEEFEKQRIGVLERFNGIKAERQELLERLKHNFHKSKQNSEDYSRMFSGDTDVQEEDDINKAFMLSDDLEKKKTDMINRNEALGKEKKQLVERMNANTQAWNETIQIYNSSFDDQKLPPLQAPENT